ncbi:MAG: hypothetical protein AB1414_04965 [bacterium]
MFKTIRGIYENRQIMPIEPCDLRPDMEFLITIIEKERNQNRGVKDKSAFIRSVQGKYKHPEFNSEVFAARKREEKEIERRKFE